MRILYLAHRIPFPPNKGEKIRAFHQVAHLAKRHVVDMVGLATCAAEAAAARAGLAEVCNEVEVELVAGSAFKASVRSLLSNTAVSNTFFRSEALISSVRARLSQKQYDLIVVYCSSMGQYVPDDCQIPVAVDFVDADSAKWRLYAEQASFPMNLVYAREYRHVLQLEASLAARATVGVAATPREAQFVAGGLSRIDVVENGVEFREQSHVPAFRMPNGNPYVVFVGQMDYLPNVDAVNFFAREVLPLVRAKCPQLGFAIVGRCPSRAVKALGKIPGVVVTGEVPDVRPYLTGATAAVAPLRIARGVQNKILESLAAGLPVVATSAPADAIGADSRQVLLVADSATDFADHVVKVVADPETRRRFSQGKEFVRRRFDWETNNRKLEELLLEAAGQKREEREAAWTH